MAKDILSRLVMLKGERGATIEKIEILSSQGSTDIMRITLSNGETVDFPVTNTLDDNHIKEVIDEVTEPALVIGSDNPVSGSGVFMGLTWEGVDTKAPLDASWTSIDFDITDYIDKAVEFMVVVTLKSSTAYDINVSIVIPNTKITAQIATKQDYIQGYYYSSEYNGSVLARLDRTNKTISILKSWTQVTGSTLDVEQVELFVRGARE